MTKNHEDNKILSKLPSIMSSVRGGCTWVGSATAAISCLELDPAIFQVKFEFSKEQKKKKSLITKSIKVPSVFLSVRGGCTWAGSATAASSCLRDDSVIFQVKFEFSQEKKKKKKQTNKRKRERRSDRTAFYLKLVQHIFRSQNSED